MGRGRFEQSFPLPRGERGRGRRRPTRPRSRPTTCREPTFDERPIASRPPPTLARHAADARRARPRRPLDDRLVHRGLVHRARRRRRAGAGSRRWRHTRLRGGRRGGLSLPLRLSLHRRGAVDAGRYAQRAARPGDRAGLRPALPDRRGRGAVGGRRVGRPIGAGRLVAAAPERTLRLRPASRRDLRWRGRSPAHPHRDRRQRVRPRRRDGDRPRRARPPDRLRASGNRDAAARRRGRARRHGAAGRGAQRAGRHRPAQPPVRSAGPRRAPTSSRAGWGRAAPSASRGSTSWARRRWCAPKGGSRPIPDGEAEAEATLGLRRADRKFPPSSPTRGLRGIVATLSNALLFTGRPTEVDGRDALALDVVVKDGDAQVGILPLGCATVASFDASKACARRTKPATSTRSARRSGAIPAASSSAAASPRLLRLARSILRRWPKAAAVTASSAPSVQGRGSRRGSRWTTLDVTLGGGTKALAATSKRRADRVRQPASTASRP